MGYVRLFRRVRLAPGISLNLSGSGPSVSLGMRGAHVTVGKSGVRQTVGIPGTGVFYTNREGWHSGVHSSPTVHGNAGKGLAIVVFGFLLGAGIVALLLWGITAP
jgi:hypothetical protein